MILYNLFIDYFKKNYLLVLSYIFFYTLAYSLESVLLPRMSANLFVNFTKSKINNIYTSLYYIVFVWIIIQSSLSLAGYVDSKLIPSVWVYLRDFVVKSVYFKYENEYKDIDLGKVQGELSSIPGNFIDFFYHAFEKILPRIFITMIIIVYLFTINWRIGVVFSFMILVPFILLYSFKIGQCRTMSNERYQQFLDMMSDIQDKFSNLTTIYTSGKMNDEIKKMCDQHKNYGDYYSKQIGCTNNIKIISYFLNIAIFVIMNLLNLYLFKKDMIDSKTFIALFMTFLYLINHLTRISQDIPHVILKLGIINENDKFLNTLKIDEREKELNDNKPNISIQQSRIEFKNVSFIYPGTKYKIINNLNLKISNNEKICILGSSGSGKSTLFKLLLKLHSPTNGIIYIDGKNIQNYNTNDLRSRISYVNQNTKLFQTTIYENIRYTNPNLNKKYIDVKIKEFGLEGIFKNINNNYETNCGIQGNSLSGGQRQVVILLRELLNPASKIIVLDEPTSAIDDHHKRYIYNFIDKLNKEKTVIVITHDRNNLGIYNKVYELKDGRIVEI